MFVRRLLPKSKAVAQSSASLRFAPYANRYKCGASLQLRHRFFSSVQPNHNGIRILYASQTGTAQLFAHQLAEGLEDEGLEDVTVQGLDEEPPNETFTPGYLHLLLASSSGKGEPPDNARKFYDWAMKDPSAKLSDDVNFAVFGLGNESAHPNNYNVVGKQFDAQLEKLGAHRMKDLALGDDGGCIEGDFDEWMNDISKLVVGSQGGDGESSEVSESLDFPLTEDKGEELERPAVAMAESPDKTRMTSKKHPTLALDPAQSNVVRRDLFHLTGSKSNRFYAEKTAKLKVIGNHILTPDAGQSALHEIRVSLECDHANSDKPDLSYTTGDHFLVYPRNSEAIVNAYVDMLDVDPHAIISENNSDSYPHPTGISVMETLIHCVDLGALPSPGFSRMILGRKELDYVNEIANPRRTVVDLCHQMGTELSLEDVLYNAVPMKPRYYSIASSSIKNPDEIHIVFRPVHYMTSKGYLREGVCTNYLTHKGVAQGVVHDIACLPVLVSPNPTFRLPENPKTPVIFIAGGCGVAPIKAFIEERITLQSRGRAVGAATMFLGFRTPQDEVYHDLVQEALEVGALTESEVVYNSSGCDVREHCQQMLVSDLVRLKSENVWNHIQNGGHIYICGGARTFGVAIEAAFLDIFQEQGMDFDGAIKYLRDLAEEGRLAEDLAN